MLSGHSFDRAFRRAKGTSKMVFPGSICAGDLLVLVIERSRYSSEEGLYEEETPKGHEQAARLIKGPDGGAEGKYGEREIQKACEYGCMVVEAPYG